MSDVEWNVEEQEVLLSYLLGDPNLFARCRSITEPRYFDARLRSTVKYIVEFADQYNTLPHTDQIAARTKVVLNPIPHDEQQDRWFEDQYQSFCRRKALELVSLDSLDLIEKGEYGEYERRLKEALTVGLPSTLGLDYFADPAARLAAMRDKSNLVSTGWKDLDNVLGGGFLRGGLHLFSGTSGAGKSQLLQNLAINSVTMGLHCIYYSLELGEEYIGLRFDAMITGRTTTEAFREHQETSLLIRQFGRKHTGSLHVSRLSEAGTTAADIRAHIKNYIIKTGNRPDIILVDYLDLLYPMNKRIDPSNLFVKDKYCSEELRALAGDENLVCASATQLNRGAVEAEDFHHGHMSGGISKVMTADTLLGINNSLSHREKGLIELQVMKTRTSNKKDAKITLACDPDSMRITDLDPGMQAQVRKSADTLRKELRPARGGIVAEKRQGPPSANETRAKMLAIQRKRGIGGEAPESDE